MLTPYHTAPGLTLLHGDCLTILPELPSHSVDAIVTDPPYDLVSKGGRGGFMGLSWDATGVAFQPETWRAVLRVAKPGTHLLAMGSTRTYHRLVTAIEDAGWSIRDTIVWLHGQGFPKGLDISKALDKAAGAERNGIATHIGFGPFNHGSPECRICGRTKGGQAGNCHCDKHGQPATDLARQWDGWNVALKPACELIVLARAPLSEPTVAANVARWGTGALNIGATRLTPLTSAEVARSGMSTKADGWGMQPRSWKNAGQLHAGRWPANVVLSHSLFCQPAGMRRVRGGNAASRGGNTFGGDAAYRYEDGMVLGYADPDGYETVDAWDCAPECPIRLLDAQSGERRSGARNGQHIANSGKYGRVYGTYEANDTGNAFAASVGGASRFFYCAKPSASERSRGLPDGERNGHPTVKSQELMGYLIRLITPPGGTVLDPFAGSGSTGIAALAGGWEFIGIEQDAGYIEIARQRLAAPA